MDELVAWIREQLDERARAAQAACHGGEGRWHQTDPDREHGRIEDEHGEVVTYDEGSPSGYQAAHIALNDPATELREVEAKRALLLLAEVLRTPVPTPVGYPERARLVKLEVEKAEEDAANAMLRLLALPLADCPGYRSEWAPADA